MPIPSVFLSVEIRSDLSTILDLIQCALMQKVRPNAQKNKSPAIKLKS